MGIYLSCSNRWRNWAVEDGVRLSQVMQQDGGRSLWSPQGCIQEVRLPKNEFILASDSTAPFQEAVKTEKSVTPVEDTSFDWQELQVQKDQPKTVATITPFISKLTAMMVLTGFPEVL